MTHMQVTTSEDFTPGEAAYFKSGGQDTAALDAEIAADPPEPAGGQQPSHQAEQPKSQTAAPEASAGQDEGSEDDELVTVGPDGKPRNDKGRFVPHAALHKEREKHKLTKTELETTREKMARADERLTVLNEILTKADEKPAATQVTKPPIDPEKDPIGALQSALAEIKRLEGEISTSKTQSQERENARSMQQAYQNDAVRYLSEKPEFKDAYGFLIQGRHRELEAMGMSDLAERNRFIANEERGIVTAAFQSRRSPSQMLHSLAVARGFKPAQQQQQQDPVKKIEQIAAGQKQAGASLSGAGGSSGEGLTASALADMSEEEFASVAAKLGKSKLKQLLGG